MLFATIDELQTIQVPEPTTQFFKAVSLRDQIRNAMDSGVVVETIPISVAYDEEPTDYDPWSNIRESRLEMFELGSMQAAERKAASVPTPVAPVPEPETPPAAPAASE